MRRALIGCLLGLVVSGVCFPGAKNNYLAPEKRGHPGGRDLQIVVGQVEIQPTINVSNLTVPLGGGLLIGLIDVGINDARTKQAEKNIVPLRDSLMDYDFDSRAREASRATLAGFEWFALRETRLSKDASRAGLLSAIAATDTSQAMFLNYHYETDPDFTSVIVTLNVALVNKAMPKTKIRKPIVRFWPEHLVLNQTLRSVITLPDTNHWHDEENLQAWSADGGKNARAALDLGLERCQQLLKRTLEMSKAEAAAMQKRKNRRMVTEPGVTGWVIEADAAHRLVYSGQNRWLTYVETFGAAATP
jgi:hypothetical protein